jgi:hypothetical protein
MKTPKTILKLPFFEFIVLCAVAFFLFNITIYSFFINKLNVEDYILELTGEFLLIVLFYYLFILGNNIIAIFKMKKNAEYLEVLKDKPQFFRWFILTWPLVALILLTVFIWWIWLFYSYLIVSIIYLASPLIKKILHYTNTDLNKLIIISILITATMATVYFWYKAEHWSIFAKSGADWFLYTPESMQSIDFEYTKAFQRSIITWIVSICWIIYLGLKNKIRQ